MDRGRGGRGRRTHRRRRTAGTRAARRAPSRPTPPAQPRQQRRSSSGCAARAGRRSARGTRARLHRQRRPPATSRSSRTRTRYSGTTIDRAPRGTRWRCGDSPAASVLDEEGVHGEAIRRTVLRHLARRAVPRLEHAEEPGVLDARGPPCARPAAGGAAAPSGSHRLHRDAGRAPSASAERDRRVEPGPRSCARSALRPPPDGALGARPTGTGSGIAAAARHVLPREIRAAQVAARLGRASRRGADGLDEPDRRAAVQRRRDHAHRVAYPRAHVAVQRAPVDPLLEAAG